MWYSDLIPSQFGECKNCNEFETVVMGMNSKHYTESVVRLCTPAHIVVNIWIYLDFELFRCSSDYESNSVNFWKFDGRGSSNFGEYYW